MNRKSFDENIFGKNRQGEERHCGALPDFPYQRSGRDAFAKSISCLARRYYHHASTSFGLLVM